MKKPRRVLDPVLKILNLYIALLAIFGLLITLNIFSINIKPDIDILEPVYIFNMKSIIDVIKPYVNICEQNYYNDLKELLTHYGMPDSLFGKIKYFEYVLPYEVADNSLYSGWSSFNLKNSIWYYMGIDDTLKVPQTSMNFLARRTNKQKRIGLTLMLTSDFLRVASEKSLSPGGELNINPLNSCYQLKDIISIDSIAKIFYSTEIYSIISLSNYSSEYLSDIRLYINDVIGSGNLKVIGWTSAAQGVAQVSRGPNIRINIDRLEPYRSIEILLRGSKLIRKDDIQVSIPRFSSINKILVILIMAILLIMSIFICLLDKEISK